MKGSLIPLYLNAFLLSDFCPSLILGLPSIFLESYTSSCLYSWLLRHLNWTVHCRWGRMFALCWAWQKTVLFHANSSQLALAAISNVFRKAVRVPWVWRETAPWLTDEGCHLHSKGLQWYLCSALDSFLLGQVIMLAVYPQELDLPCLYSFFHFLCYLPQVH